MSDRRGARRRLWAMLAASLALHAVVALLLFRAVGARDRPAALRRAPVELEVRWAEAPPRPAPPPPTAPPSRSVAAPSRPSASARPVSPAPAAAPAPVATMEPAPSGGVAVPSGPRDAPRAAPPSLLPRAGFTSRLESGLDDELPRGITLGNTPADFPDPVAMQEYRGDELRRGLNTQLKQDLAQAEAGAGRVAPYFQALQRSLRDRATAKGVRRSAATPSEVAEVAGRALLTPTISPEAARKVADSPMGRSVMNQTVPMDLESQRFRESALQAMAQSEAVKERLEQPTLSTVLAITFDATGAIADTSVEVASSDPTFDDSALQLSRAAVRELPELDLKGLGTSWWRTRWRFSWAPTGVRVSLLDAVPLNPELR